MDSEKKLLRPRDGAMIGGVCAGVARWLGLDATLVRLAWVIMVVLFGTGILVYFICWVVIPQEDSV